MIATGNHRRAFLRRQSPPKNRRLHTKIPRKGEPSGERGSALVLVLTLVLVLILILVSALLVLVLILVLIAILIIHTSNLPNNLRFCRRGSMPFFSGFILGTEQEAHEKSRRNGGGDAAGGGFQAARENTQEAIVVHGLLYTLG